MDWIGVVGLQVRLKVGIDECKDNFRFEQSTYSVLKMECIQ